MKKFIAFLVTVGFIAAIILGSIHWDKRIASATKGSSDDRKAAAETETSQESDKVMPALPKHFPVSLADKLQKKSVSLVVMGDEATSAAPEGWPAKLKAKLDEVYGEGVWKVTVKEWKGESTTELLAHNRIAELATLKPDIVLFEVPLLTDNLETGNGNSIVNVQALLRQLKTGLPDCVVVLQPPNPVYNTTYYPKAVEALKQFAVKNQYAYLDHWTAWPNPASKEIVGYLQEQVGFPNEKGNEVWAQAVEKYFIEE